MPRSIFFSAAVTLALLTGCSMMQSSDEADLISQFSPVSTEAQVQESVVGHTWKSDEITVQFTENGALSGSINGVEVDGTWAWKDGQFCSSFRVADSGGEGCSTLGLKGNEMLVVPLAGAGAPYTYTRS